VLKITVIVGIPVKFHGIVLKRAAVKLHEVPPVFELMLKNVERAKPKTPWIPVGTAVLTTAGPLSEIPSSPHTVRTQQSLPQQPRGQDQEVEASPRASE